MVKISIKNIYHVLLTRNVTQINQLKIITYKAVKSAINGRQKRKYNKGQIENFSLIHELHFMMYNFMFTG